MSKIYVSNGLTTENFILEKLLLTEGDQILEPGTQYIDSTPHGIYDSHGIFYFADPYSDAFTDAASGNVPGMGYRNKTHSGSNGKHFIIGHNHFLDDHDGNPGGLIALFDGESSSGGFNIRSVNSTTQSYFTGNVSGELNFNGIRLDYNVGSNYIQWGNGESMCWGQCTSSSSGAVINFPVPATGSLFTSAPNVIVGIRGGNSTTIMYAAKAQNITATQFTLVCVRRTGTTNTLGNYTCNYIAFGWNK